MSEQHVEIVQRHWAGFTEGGIDGAALEILHPEVELMGAVGGIEEGTVTRGREAVRQALLIDSEVWADRRFGVPRIFDAGDRVVVLVREYRKGKGSGVEVEADIAFVYEFRERKTIRITPYMNQEEALEAAGLQE
jgi:ketosteroid isomerase-like protein